QGRHGCHGRQQARPKERSDRGLGAERRTDLAAGAEGGRGSQDLCRPHAGAEADQARARLRHFHRHQLRRCDEADLTVTTLASQTESVASSRPSTAWATLWWPRLRAALLAVAFPLVLLAICHFSTAGRPGSLIPPPYA